MITGEEHFAEVAEQIEAQAARALEVAVVAGAAAANAASTTIDLELELKPATPTPAGYSAGITSKKRGSRSGARLAPFFDGGTLGKRRRKLATNRGRREEWSVDRDGGSYTAHRQELTGEMGIEPENFFAAARRAGRAAMLAELEHHHL